MVYSSEKRRAYYLSHKEHHLNYSKGYVERNREKYIQYYKQYNAMKSQLAKKLKYKDGQPITKPKLEIKPKKAKGLCEICNDNYKGSFKQHILTTKHLINEQVNHSKNLKSIKYNIMTSTSIKYFDMFTIKDLKEALVLLGHEEVEDMNKEELYAYIITLINADDIEDDSSEEESEDEDLVFKCAYSE